MGASLLFESHDDGPRKILRRFGGRHARDVHKLDGANFVNVVFVLQRLLELQQADIPVWVSLVIQMVKAF